MNRNPLEVFGKHGSSLRIEGSALVYADGKKETTIPITTLKQFSLSPPNFFHNGCISITIAQGFLSAGKFLLPLKDINETEYAKNIQKYIAEFQANSGAPSKEFAPCKLDQIAKLKALFDDGAINEEEFSALKKELIGL